MKERPILFSGAMVRAIIEGQKTQTRRVIATPAGLNQPVFYPGRGWRWTIEKDNGVWPGPSKKCAVNFLHCPYGQPIDRLWVRETFAKCHPGQLQHLDPDPESPHWFSLYRADGVSDNYIADYGEKWKPSIFMPRLASRITLEVTAVRVERVADISEEDAIAEGVEREPDWNFWKVLTQDGGSYSIGQSQPKPVVGEADRTGRIVAAFVPVTIPGKSATNAYQLLWDSINAKRGFGWDKNPWVWVVEFKRVEQEARPC